jgi:hypothetical protein
MSKRSFVKVHSDWCSLERGHSKRFFKRQAARKFRRVPVDIHRDDAPIVGYLDILPESLFNWRSTAAPVVAWIG